MARPKRYNAEYFSHDADMRNDVRIKAVRRKFSHTGYAVWSYLLETLTDSDFFEIDWDEINIELLAADYDVTIKDLRDIVEYCVKIGLLQMQDNKLLSQTHQSRLKTVIENREQKRVNGKLGGNPNFKKGQTNPYYKKEETLPEDNPEITDPYISTEETLSEDKQSKVKESKVKESKEYTLNPPSIPPSGGAAAAAAEIDNDPPPVDDPQDSPQSDTETTNPDVDPSKSFAAAEPSDPQDPPPTMWKKKFDLYLADLRRAYLSATHDEEWIAQRQKFHPNIDILLSLEKACSDFWSTQEGWCHKRKEHRGKGTDSQINWRNTFNNTLTLKSNQVQKSQYTKSYVKESF